MFVLYSCGEQESNVRSATSEKTAHQLNHNVTRWNRRQHYRSARRDPRYTCRIVTIQTQLEYYTSLLTYGERSSRKLKYIPCYTNTSPNDA